jgi:hypothetical protein
MKIISKSLTLAFFLVITFIVATLFIPTLIFAAEFNNKAPAFIIEYPDDFVSDPLKPGEVLRVKHPNGVPSFEIQISDVPESGPDFEGYGKGYAEALKALGTDVKILSGKATQTEDGTPAHETEIEWKWQGTFQLVSLIFVTAKDKKYVAIGGHTGGDLDPIRDILETFEFE